MKSSRCKSSRWKVIDGSINENWCLLCQWLPAESPCWPAKEKVCEIKSKPKSINSSGFKLWNNLSKKIVPAPETS